jgi:hypothetical protein
MLATIRWLSRFDETASISFVAEALSRSLYLATPFEALDDVVETHGWFVLAFFKSGQVGGVLGQRELYGLIDEVGDRAITVLKTRVNAAGETVIEESAAARLKLSMLSGSLPVRTSTPSEIPSPSVSHRSGFVW